MAERAKGLRNLSGNDDFFIRKSTGIGIDLTDLLALATDQRQSENDKNDGEGDFSQCHIGSDPSREPQTSPWKPFVPVEITASDLLHWTTSCKVRKQQDYFPGANARVFPESTKYHCNPLSLLARGIARPLRQKVCSFFPIGLERSRGGACSIKNQEQLCF
jgi:hypothetical protein